MIRCILLPLDTEADTSAATQVAVDIARRYDAEITGLAVVDTEGIEGSSRGGGIGSFYYAEQLRERLTNETRQTASRLIGSFEQAMHAAGVRFRDEVTEGVPFQRIVEDAKYADLLVVGRDPHFFYGHPNERTQTLARVVKESGCPVLTVPDAVPSVERVLAAFDGSDASARTVRQFAQLLPFGDSVAVHVLTVGKSSREEDEAQLRLSNMRAFLEAHGLPVTTAFATGDPFDQIQAHAEQSQADLILAGAHAVGQLKRMAFGSTTASLIENERRPLFLHH
jgi:nucleotide-binding universal stress UspA family protein